MLKNTLLSIAIFLSSIALNLLPVIVMAGSLSLFTQVWAKIAGFQLGVLLWKLIEPHKRIYYLLHFRQP